MARRYEFYFRVVKYCFCHEKIKFISSSCRVMFFLLYRPADEGVLMIFQEDFRPPSEDFRRFSKIVPKARRTFPNIFREFPKISEDCRRLPKIAEDFRGRLENVSMIHQRI